MFALLRLLIVGFILLTIIYVALSLYSRSQRRKKLEAKWNDSPQGDQDVFVQQGLEEYDGSVRRKLIFGVYVVPAVIVGIIIYLTNFA